jgi:small subunit ribosomal protein S15
MEEEKKTTKKAAAASPKKQGRKVDLIKKYQSHKDDTGSTEVQIAILTKKVSDLTKHLQSHKKDFDSRRGLLMMVGKRRRLLNYLKKIDEEKYAKLILDLGLRK